VGRQAFDAAMPTTIPTTAAAKGTDHSRYRPLEVYAARAARDKRRISSGVSSISMVSSSSSGGNMLWLFNDRYSTRPKRCLGLAGGGTNILRSCDGFTGENLACRSTAFHRRLDIITGRVSGQFHRANGLVT
jgi:hypothetical protein